MRSSCASLPLTLFVEKGDCPFGVDVQYGEILMKMNAISISALMTVLLFSISSGYASLPNTQDPTFKAANTAHLTVPGDSKSISADDTDRASELIGVNPFSVGGQSLPQLPNNYSENFIQVDAGSSAVCAILKNRQLHCWGLNNFGQATPPPGKYKQVSVGQLHACALNTKGGLVCWGEKTGIPGLEDQKGPYIKVSSGDNHTCALLKQGGVKCWGKMTTDS